MRIPIAGAATLLILFAMSVPDLQGQQCASPKAQTGGVLDDYHGTKVADPYRWLEDTDALETKAWIEAENCVTFGFLERIPEREQIRQRLTKIWDYPKYGTPFKDGGRYFFFKNDGLQNQSVLYVQRTLADPRRSCSTPTGSRKTGPSPSRRSRSRMTAGTWPIRPRPAGPTGRNSWYATSRPAGTSPITSSG